MTEGFDSHIALPQQSRRAVLEAAASRLETLPGYVETDFWVCLVLDALFNRRPEGHPRLVFKGGTSRSKAFGLINRFSDDIDLVMSRDGHSFEVERDPTVTNLISEELPASGPPIPSIAAWILGNRVPRGIVGRPKTGTLVASDAGVTATNLRAPHCQPT